MTTRITIRIQEILKGLINYYCNSYRQPRTEHSNPRWKFQRILFIIIIITTVTVVVVVITQSIHLRFVQTHNKSSC